MKTILQKEDKCEEAERLYVGKKAETLVSTGTTTLVVVVLLAGTVFGTGTFWPDVGVLETRGESLIIKEQQ